MENLFGNIFDSSTQTISVGKFLLCVLVALIIGVLFTIAYSYKNKTTNTFKVSLLLLPVATTMVIMMVNGNIGVGVAIAGAFSLVRFRSSQGNAKEICFIFTEMCSGLILGVGYMGYAILFTVIGCVVIVTLNKYFNKKEEQSRERILKISIPEDLDYMTVFDDVFSKYLKSVKLVNSKTANMGSIYRLKYEITFNNIMDEKIFIDDIRARNGNLEVAVLREEENANNL